MTHTRTPAPPAWTLFRFAAIRVLTLFAFHAIVFATCAALAYLVRFDFAIPEEHLTTLWQSLPVILGVQLFFGMLFGFYRGWWRYVGMGDVFRLVFGLSASLGVLLALWYSADFLHTHMRLVTAPRGVLLIDWSFALLMLFGARVLIRVGRDRFRPADPSMGISRVLIVGAGDAGEALAREIEHRPQMGLRVVGFVDDQRAKWGSHIRGINVHGPISSIGEIADSLAADEAFIAIPSASGKRVREIIRHLADADLHFRTIPGIDQLVSGRVHVTQLREVKVEDLIRRKQIALPGDAVRQMFVGKRVLVTGAGGTIGSELSSQVLEYGPAELHLVERSEHALYEVARRLTSERRWQMDSVHTHLLDIRDGDDLRTLIDRVRPEIVLHAAAHKHVPIGERNPAEYIRNNALATFKLASTCAEAGVQRFVFISSDKAINPSSVMGATKRAAEIALLDLATRVKMKVTMVRFGNVIGSSGSVIPLFLEQIRNGQPITVTHPDVTRYFIRTSEAVSLVFQAATLGDSGNIFMLDMGEPIKIVDLARDLIRLSNHTEDEIPIVFTGLRAGEKLFEEIRLKGEDIRATVHPQIVVTETAQPQHDKIETWLERVEQKLDAAAAVQALQDLIPEYRRPELQPVEPVLAEAAALSPVYSS
ncbi:MAG TPA: nucleoside-diphosphate sugar epimerase/dehydratase [Thermoanaerobaculia bacterium]|nr:nucleoside-diphosphate sugar epimerase/dehydratase [Thermoanaerobaculia bacterium]